MQSNDTDDGPGGGDDLRELLRRGDPLGDERGLCPDEALRLRRAIMAAARPARPWLPARALTGAAATAALILLVWAGVGIRRRPVPGPLEVPGEAAIEGSAAEAEEPAAAQPAGTRVPDASPAIAAPGAIGGPEPDAPPPALLATAQPATERAARQVQFTAPGGTRIIWTLDPEFKL